MSIKQLITTAADGSFATHDVDFHSPFFDVGDIVRSQLEIHPCYNG